jgi:hypothetical protein
MKKPTRRFKSFKAYLESWAEGYNSDYPCHECFARGKVRDYDNHEADPIEGHKFTPFIDCKICNGTGELTKVRLKEAYDLYVEYYKTDLEFYIQYTKNTSQRQAKAESSWLNERRK